MLGDINCKIKELEEDVLVKKRVESRIKELKMLIEEQEKVRQKEYGIFYEEKKDVEALKNLSLTSLYYSIIGRKARKLDQEEREMLNAKLRVDRLDSKLVLLEDEYSYEKKRLTDILSKERAYNRLLKEKKEILKQLPNVGEEIENMESKLLQKKTLMKEIDEALRAGENAQNALHQASATLDSARNWGIYDIMSKKSWISSIVKQNKLKSAQGDMNRANYALDCFRSELLDVQKTYTDELSFSGLVKTFDIWFDNIFTDIHVQRKINAARDDVSSTIRSIDETLRELRKEKEAQQNHVDVLEHKLEEMIVQAR